MWQALSHWGSPVSECETCDGTGRVTEVNTVVTDRGTRWQRSADEMVTSECSSCDGSGNTEVRDANARMQQ